MLYSSDLDNNWILVFQTKATLAPYLEIIVHTKDTIF